jgi:hypothetical protein
MGRCWLVCELYEQLKLDQFWAERPPARTRRPTIGSFFTNVMYISFYEPGSEWHLANAAIDVLDPLARSISLDLKGLRNGPHSRQSRLIKDYSREPS